MNRSLGQKFSILLVVLVVGAISYMGYRATRPTVAETSWQKVFTENWDNADNWTKYNNPNRSDSQGPRIRSNFTVASDSSSGKFARIWTRKSTDGSTGVPVGSWASGGGLLNGNRYRAVKVDTKIRLSKATGVRGVMLLWPNGGTWSDEIDFYEIGADSPNRTKMVVSVHEPKQAGYSIWGKTSDPFPTGNHTILRGSDSRDYSQWHDVQLILEPNLLQVKVDDTVVFKTTDVSKVYHAKSGTYKHKDGSTYTWDGTYYLGMQTAAPGRPNNITSGYMDVGPITLSVPNGTTTAPAPTELDKPLNLRATSVSNKSITLDWDNIASGLKYQVRRDNSTIATLNSPTTTYTDSTVVKGTTYKYNLIASDSNGNVVSSKDVTVAASIPDDMAKPLDFHATEVSKSKISFGWNNLMSGLTYTVLRDGVAIGTIYSPNVTYTDSNVVEGKTYTYMLTAADNAMHQVYSRNLQLTADFPVEMQKALNFHYTNRTKNSISFAWTNLMSGLTYSVYRDGVKVGETTSPVASYVDGGLVSRHSYTYQLLANDSVPHIAKSGTLTIKTR